jgi:hypothetical protein
MPMLSQWFTTGDISAALGMPYRYDMSLAVPSCQVATLAALCARRIKQAVTFSHDAVTSMSEDFVIRDHEDRLVMCNDAYRRIRSEAAHLLVLGIRFEDIVRHVVTARSKPEPDFDNVGPYVNGKAYRIHDLAQSMREALDSRRMRQAGDGREQAAGTGNNGRT